MEAQPWTSKYMQDATNFCIWQCDAIFGFASLHFKVWHCLDKVSIYFDMDLKGEQESSTQNRQKFPPKPETKKYQKPYSVCFPLNSVMP